MFVAPVPGMGTIGCSRKRRREAVRGCDGVDVTWNDQVPRISALFARWMSLGRIAYASRGTSHSWPPAAAPHRLHSNRCYPADWRWTVVSIDEKSMRLRDDTSPGSTDEEFHRLAQERATPLPRTTRPDSTAE